MKPEITKKMYLLAKEVVKEYESLNIKEIKKPIQNKLELQFTFSDISKKEVFDQWLNYRKEIKRPIKAKSTLIRLADKFEKESLEKCKFVVSSSISNQYQGLFWDNYKQQVSKNELSATDKLKQSLGL